MIEAVLAPELEQALQVPLRGVPGAEHLEPFLTGAREVLEAELGVSVERGPLRREAGSHTTQDVTALVGITGAVTGLAIYAMSRETALSIVAQLMGAPVEELSDLALSGIGELGNVITGRAATLLAEQGIVANIAPPALLVGPGRRVSMAGIQRLVVPLVAPLGTVEAQLAIKG
ncbi:MAG TPA: chemotaxis protein CheX [Chloroflexota bacterium]|nr:chemotaxis protein CheX [Chloroflexota bacterium]